MDPTALGPPICRNIKTLYNFDPPATDEEIRAASLQFVRKLSGFNRPSKSNEQAFGHAVDQVARTIGSAGTTEMARTEALMDQERRVLKLPPKIASWRIAMTGA